MKIRSEHYKRNMTVYLSTLIIIVPGSLVLMSYFVMSFLAYLIQGIVFFETEFFEDKKNRYKWYLYYFYGVSGLYAIVAVGTELMAIKVSDFAFSIALVGAVVFFIELYLAVEIEELK